MNSLHRVGLATSRHPWRTIAAWLLVLVALGGLAASLGGELRDNWNVPDTRAQHGVDQLREHFPDTAGSSAQVVIHDDQRASHLNQRRRRLDGSAGCGPSRRSRWRGRGWH